MYETCEQYVTRRLSEGWSIVWQSGYHLILSSPDGNILRPVDLRNDVETLRPNAAGDEENIDNVSGDGVGTHYTTVDEAEADGDTTHIYTKGSDWLRDLYNISDHSVGSGTINHITVYAVCGALGIPSQTSLKIAIKSGTGSGNPDTPDESAGIELTSVDYLSYSNEWATNPATSSAWTWDEIDKLQIGITIRESSGGKPTKCTQVYVEVDYTPYTLHEKTLTDGLKVGEALIKTPMPVFSDGIALADILVKNPIKTLADGIAFTDVWEGYKLISKVLSDGIAFTDALVKSTSKVVSDAMAFTDTVVKRLERVLADGIKLADVWEGYRLFERVYTDGIAFTDVLPRIFERVFTDGIKFTDTLVKLWVRKAIRLLGAIRNLLSEREEPM